MVIVEHVFTEPIEYSIELEASSIRKCALFFEIERESIPAPTYKYGYHIHCPRCNQIVVQHIVPSLLGKL
jgi:hypothetical protein